MELRDVALGHEKPPVIVSNQLLLLPKTMIKGLISPQTASRAAAMMPLSQEAAALIYICLGPVGLQSSSMCKCWLLLFFRCFTCAPQHVPSLPPSLLLI